MNSGKLGMGWIERIKSPKTKSEDKSKLLAAVAIDAARRIERKKQGDK